MAIILVVLCHAGVPGFAGGYVGVDVFFVISGFLITRLLIDEHERTGTVALWTFYARRVRRLLPALLLMLLVVTLLALWLVPADRIGSQLDDAAWTSVWLANFDHALSRVDYFGPAREDSLFLHAWSLGVEEQFYLVWPMLVVALWWIAKGRMQFAMALMGCLVVAGFAVNVAETARDPLGAYFLPHVRFWQFAIGGQVVLLSMRARCPDWAALSMGMAGLAMVLAAVVVYSYATPYPGWAALLPTVGTALLLMSGANPMSTLMTRLLTSDLAVSLGKVSYGWYLWHWPLIVLSAERWPFPLVRPMAALIALIAAIVSYRLIERPMRARPIQVARTWVLVGVLLGLGSFFLLTFAIRVIDNSRAHPAAESAAPVPTLPKIYDAGCDDYYRSDALEPCFFGTPDADRTLVVVGDSIGLQWFPALELIYADWRIVVLTKSACPMVNEPYFNESIRRRFVECEVWRARVLDYVAVTKPDLVIIGSSGNYEFPEARWEDGTVEMLDRLRDGTDRVIVIKPTPKVPFSIAQCADDLDQSGVDCQVALEEVRWTNVEAALQRAADRVPGVSTLDLNDSACPLGRCRAMVGDMLAFRDSQHLSAAFVERATEGVRGRLRAAGALRWE